MSSFTLSIHRGDLSVLEAQKWTLASNLVGKAIYGSWSLSAYLKLNEIVESRERQLVATQFCEPESPGLLAIVDEQRTRAAQGVLTARAKLDEHMNGCSKCVRWLM